MHFRSFVTSSCLLGTALGLKISKNATSTYAIPKAW